MKYCVLILEFKVYVCLYIKKKCQPLLYPAYKPYSPGISFAHSMLRILPHCFCARKIINTIIYCSEDVSYLRFSYLSLPNALTLNNE